MAIAALRQEVKTVVTSSAAAEAAEVVGEAMKTGSIVMKRDSSSLPPATASMKKKWQLSPSSTSPQTQRVM